MTNTINHADREHALLSASSAHRWLACPPSAVAAELYPDNDTEYTREGTRAHEVAEAVASGNAWRLQQLASEPDVTAEMIEHAHDYAAYVQEHKTSEHTQALFETRVDFSTWVPGGFGTCDCILLDDDKLKVIDYKYGAGVPVSAVDNEQMKLYALGAWYDYGFAYDIETIELHIYQPRINNISVYELTLDALMHWAEKTVKPIAEKAAQGKGKHCVGSHCRFCPHAGKCRALTNACTEYVEAHDIRVGVPVLSAYEVADVLSMTDTINLWLKRVQGQAMATLLEGGEIPGYKLVEGRGSRDWASEEAVAQTLGSAGYSPATITKTELLSPAAMEKAIGKKKVAELLDSYIVRKSGAPTLAPESDKRPPYNRLAEAQQDFND